MSRDTLIGDSFKDGAESLCGERMLSATPLLEVRDLECTYGGAQSWIPGFRLRAKPVVQDVSFTVQPGETFALVGESGSGKSTIARAIAGLIIPTSGEILYRSASIVVPAQKRSKKLRASIQLIFQNPDASLNPRRKISYSIGRPLEFFFGLSGVALRRRVAQLLEDVRLDPSYGDRLPDQLSGGERQRVAIARALAAEPDLLLCDEILSALDVSVQASILSLLRALQMSREITFLFISHDLAVVWSLAQHVGVLYLGELCEAGPIQAVFRPPFHPYTQLLLSAVPEPTPGLQSLDSVLPDPGSLSSVRPTGCPFAPRCFHKVGAICEEEKPPWKDVVSGHSIRCHAPLSVLYTTDGLSWLSRENNSEIRA